MMETFKRQLSRTWSRWQIPPFSGWHWFARDLKGLLVVRHLLNFKRFPLNYSLFMDVYTLDQLRNLDEEDKRFTAAILRSSVLARHPFVLE